MGLQDTTMVLFCMGCAFWIFYRIQNRKAPFGLADGLAYFCLNMIIFQLTAPHLQRTYGLWGLLATELIVLLPALIMPRLAHVRPREFFRLRFPTARHTTGGVLMWLGALLGASIGTALLTMIFPQLEESIEQVNQFISAADMPLRLLSAVLAPAICEELMHRGVILASMRGRYKDAFVVVTAGIIFGVFHLDPSRFIPTAVIGMAFAYAALRSQSILLPMLLHFMNNLFNVAVVEYLLRRPGAASSPELEELSEATQAFLTLVSQAVIAMLALALLTAGYVLLRDEKRPVRARRNPILLAAACMAVALLAQAGITAVRL